MSSSFDEAVFGSCAMEPGEVLLRFSQAVDQRRPAMVADLFTADALFRPGRTEVHGSQAIEAFYQARLANPRRTTRHLWSNVEIQRVGAAAQIRAVLTNYAFEPEVSETHLQMRLGDLKALCVAGPDGGWRFALHLYEPIFAASFPLAAPAGPAQDPRP
jgi:hypothetical protein